MSASFRRIDYSLRPAKHAERRMLCDLFRRLRPFEKVEDYIYVGFGSVWFADFILFHRALGIKNMISIEQVETAKNRIEDNKPFRIPVEYMRSRDALVKLNWKSKNFIWLDYDDPLSIEMLEDVGIATRRAESGTVLTLSVQCTKAPQVAEYEEDPSISALDRFSNIFGRTRVPSNTNEKDLYGWKYADLSRKIIKNEIESILADRNSQKTPTDPDYIKFHVIADFEYEDGAKMTTISGIFYSNRDTAILESCHFENLDFINPSSNKIRINIPKLTAREFKKLESQLPLPPDGSLELGSIPQSEANNFVGLYRYLPNFAVLEG